MFITASLLHDYIQCPHRVWRDIYGPQEEKSKETNPLVKLLWEKGVRRENEVVASFTEFTDLREGTLEERLEKTTLAMAGGDPLIYQGVLRHGNLLGIPDFLKRNTDGGYIPIDVKNTQGYEGLSEDSDKKLKKPYVTQLGLYIEIINLLGFGKNNYGFIFNTKDEAILYELDKPVSSKGYKTWWDLYFEIKKEVWDLINNVEQNQPALAGVCGLCPWQKSCQNWCLENQDLTTVFYLGREKRKVLNKDLNLTKVEDLLSLEIEEILKKKGENKFFLAGIGETTLKCFAQRANVLIKIKKPVIYQKFDFPQVDYELFLDIEDDPTQELIYLHGVYERGKKSERFLYFLAEDNNRAGEKKAWSNLLTYLKTLPDENFALYYYATHEKTAYQRLWKDYPDLISQEELTNLFTRKYTIDLYSEIILKKTDWPLSGYSLKEIAVYLGFKWREETPSGALSIEWYNKYLLTKDPQILRKIIEYNEDDCKATMFIKDRLTEMTREME